MTEHLQYILVRDNGKQGLLKYVYEGGCYRLYADNMLLGIIKKYIADYDEELVKMEEFRKAQAEVEQKKEKPLSQKMFKVV